MSETRQAEASRIREKYPDRIPVIVEKAEKSDVPVIDKKNGAVCVYCPQKNQTKCRQGYLRLREEHITPNMLEALCCNMTFNRRNGARNKSGRGHVDPIRCSNFGICCLTDKAIERCIVKNIVEQAAIRDVQEASVYEDTLCQSFTLRCNTVQSFKSKEYVCETFAWMHYYWFLTN